MTTFLTKHKLLASTAAVGFSVLAAGSAQAASFNWSYEFDANNAGVPATIFVNGMVDGDLVGDTLTNVSNVMATVTADVGGSIVTLADFTNDQFLTTMFTVSGVGVDVATDEMIEPFVSLIDSADLGDAKYSGGGVVATEDFDTSRWSLTAKSVPEGNMGVVSWLALATIGGVSAKGKVKSFFK
jgi:hypothetical protein